VTNLEYTQKLEAIADELYQAGVAHGQSGVSFGKESNFRLAEATAAIQALNVSAGPEDMPPFPEPTDKKLKAKEAIQYTSDLAMHEGYNIANKYWRAILGGKG
jgi:hypothetical protein